MNDTIQTLRDDINEKVEDLKIQFQEAHIEIPEVEEVTDEEEND